MVQFKALLEKFDDQGEKTGWMYLKVPASIASLLQPGVKKAFRVKGLLDEYPIQKVSLVPMGGGDFIIAFNAAMRKGTGKRPGAQITLSLQLDEQELPVPPDLQECLEDDPEAGSAFQKRSRAERHYFIRWIDSAKGVETRSRRIAQTLDALVKGIGFGPMLRQMKEERKELGF